MTSAVFSGDVDALADSYAEDAVLVTPDRGEVRGRESIVDYFRPFFEAFSDIRWEEIQARASYSVSPSWFIRST